MKKPSTEKQAFYSLLDKAVRTTDKSSRGKQKSQRTSGCSSKKTRQHKAVSASEKRSGKSRQ